ncbi:MAG: hypothetical protein AB7T49_14535 [Oligoflexales bacterium]
MYRHFTSFIIFGFLALATGQVQAQDRVPESGEGDLATKFLCTSMGDIHYFSLVSRLEQFMNDNQCIPGTVIYTNLPPEDHFYQGSACCSVKGDL